MQRMATEIDHMRLSRESREKSKEDRKNAKKQPLRYSLSEKEFIFILELIKHKGFVASRKKTALLLLYSTGLFFFPFFTCTC